jgi:hypothetical protein
MVMTNWGGRQILDERAENIRRDWQKASRPRPRRPVPLRARLFFGIVLLVHASIIVGPAVSAAEGHGTSGYFVAQTQSCGRHGCTWIGQFRLPGGQITRSGVTFDGDESGMRAGSVVPALDSGDLTGVFPRHGDDSWLLALAEGVIGIGVVSRATWKIAKRRRGAVYSPVERAGTVRSNARDA